MTQNQRIIEYMKQHSGITSMEASSHLGVTRLAARISEIKSSGVKVLDDFEECYNRFGEKVKFKRYRLG